MKHKRKGYVSLAFYSHTDSSQRVSDSYQSHWFTYFELTYSHPPSLSVCLSFFSFFFFKHRCLLFRPLYHHHLCQCRSSGDGTPDASFPISLQAKLHSSGLPLTAAVHHGAPSLQRKPIPGGVRSQILPLQRCRAQLLFSHLHSGRELLGGNGRLRRVIVGTDAVVLVKQELESVDIFICCI